jgi:hypothetical protein
MVGWDKGSWGYHGDDGNMFNNGRRTSTGWKYGEPFGAGSVIGCGVNFETGTAFFTKDGKVMGECKVKSPKAVLPRRSCPSTYKRGHKY